MCGEVHLVHVDPSKLTMVREPDGVENDALRCLFELELHHHLRYDTVRAELVVRDLGARVSFRDDTSLDLEYQSGDQVPVQARFYVPKAVLDGASSLQLGVMARVIAASDPIFVAPSDVQRRGL